MPDFDNSFLAEEDHPAVHEDAIVFELNGQPIGWRASGLALNRAADHGLQAGELLADLQLLFSAGVDEEDLEDLSEEEIEEELELGTNISDFFSVVAKTIWIGVLHFEPGARQQNILALLDPESIEEVPVERMLSKIFPAIDEEMGEAEGKATGKTSES